MPLLYIAAFTAAALTATVVRGVCTRRRRKQHEEFSRAVQRRIDELKSEDARIDRVIDELRRQR